jgi:hypothetical protein
MKFEVSYSCPGILNSVLSCQKLIQVSALNVGTSHETGDSHSHGKTGPCCAYHNENETEYGLYKPERLLLDGIAPARLLFSCLLMTLHRLGMMLPSKAIVNDSAPKIVFGDLSSYIRRYRHSSIKHKDCFAPKAFPLFAPSRFNPDVVHRFCLDHPPSVVKREFREGLVARRRHITSALMRRDSAPPLPQWLYGALDKRQNEPPRPLNC